MWTTQDGYRLTVTPSVVAALGARHRRLGLSELVRSNYGGSFDKAVRRSLAQIVAASYRSGALRARCGRSYLSFTAVVNGRGYIVIARPMAGSRYAIVAIRQRPEREQGEEEARHGGTASVDWTGPLPLDRAVGEDGGGVYVLEHRGVPIYVGEGGAYGGKDGRLKQRVEHLRQAGVPLDQYTVRLGKISPGPERNPNLDERRRRMVEQTAILDLNQLKAQQGQPLLTNEQSVNPYRVMPEGVEIRHRGTIPPYLQHLRGGDGAQRISRSVGRYGGLTHPQLSLPFPPRPPAPAAPQTQQLVFEGMGLQASPRPGATSAQRRGRAARSRRPGAAGRRPTSMSMSPRDRATRFRRLGAAWPWARRNREAEYDGELGAALAEDYN
jgi:hypothetical protein